MRNAKIYQFVLQIIMVLIGAFLLLPFFWLITSSFKTNAEIMSRTLVWFPKEWLWNNFTDGWRAVPTKSFGIYFKNTFFYVAIALFGALLSSSFVAFGFARVNFKFKNLLFMCLLATMMLPSQVTLIPVYMMWTNLRFTNTLVPLVFGFFTGPAYYVFLLRQFMAGIPSELDEAAICDGCTPIGIYFRILLPLCRPALFTIAMFAFMSSYDDFMGPLIYLQDPKKFTVSIGLRQFISREDASNWGYMLAMTLVSMLPPIFVFAGVQKNLVQGIATTGLKG